jgi:hypothetical protein
MVRPYEASNPQAFVSREERYFRQGKLENLVEMSQLRSVNIGLRTFSRERSMLAGDTEPVPDPIKAWVASAERRMMAGRESKSGQ